MPKSENDVSQDSVPDDDGDRYTNPFAGLPSRDMVSFEDCGASNLSGRLEVAWI